MRAKMPRSERAKQFMPFAALKGYEDALRKKEKIVVDKIILGEDAQENLNRKLSVVEKNDMVTAIYYTDGEYVEIDGIVSQLNKEERYIRIVNTKIAFDDLLDIRKNGAHIGD